MLQHNITFSFRNFRRNKTFVFINLVGLSLGMAIALLIMLYVQFHTSYESHNPNAERVVRVTVDMLDGGTLIDQDCDTYRPLAPALAAGFSDAEAYARTLNMKGFTFKIGEQYFKEPYLYAVDPAFFSIFNFPFLKGSQTNAFANPYEAVLTESIALKYFNTTDVVGERLEITGIESPLKIIGVVKDAPQNTHLKVNVLISYPTIELVYKQKENNWNNSNGFTYILLSDADKLASFDVFLKDFTQQKINVGLIRDEAFIAQKIGDIHLYSNKSFEPELNNNATSVYMLLGIAILIILIAIVNYVNLSTARSLDRAKEVGIRKVLGSRVSQLKGQFLTEAMLLILMAVVLAIVIMQFAKPHFISISNLPNTFEFINQPSFWLLILAVVIITGLTAGVFPAWIMARFEPVAVLKGKFDPKKGGVNLRKSMVVFQFAATLFLLVLTLTIGEQLRLMRNIDLGTNVNQTIVVEAPHSSENRKQFDTFKATMLQNSIVSQVAVSGCVPGLSTSELSSGTGIELIGALEQHNFNFYYYGIDANYISTMEMEIIAGSGFLPDSDNEKKLLVNEETVRLYGIPSAKEAIGRHVDFGDGNYTIIGVIKNYYQLGAKSNILPMTFYHDKRFNQFASIRYNNDDPQEQVAVLKAAYEETFPGSPFQYFFLDQKYDQNYKADQQFKQIFEVLTGFAILIAAMGLFGLTAFTISRRTKEIGVRKVLGASEKQLVYVLSKDFILLVAVAILVAIPLTYLSISSWLQQYANRINVSGWLFAAPALFMLALALIIVIFKTLQAAMANPTVSLRSE